MTHHCKWIFLLSIIVIGCTKDSIEIPGHLQDIENLTVLEADAASLFAIELVEEQSFNNVDVAVIGRIRGFLDQKANIDVDESGRVYIVDVLQNIVQVFDSDGSYLSRIGREGRGPGEYLVINRMMVHANHLYLYDRSQHKIDVYNLDSFNLTGTVNLNPENWSNEVELGLSSPEEIFARKDGTFWVRFNESPGRTHIDDRSVRDYILDSNGQLVSDKILEQKAIEWLVHPDFNGMFISSPFSRKPLIVMSGDEKMFSTWTEEFLIKVYDAQGAYQRAFYHPFEKSSLSKSELLNRSNDTGLQRALQVTEVPDTWPVMNDLLMDDENRLWAAIITDDHDEYEWWVLDDHGTLLAIFTWPRSREIRKVKDGKLYSLEVEKETGLEKVVRYRIEWN